MFSPHLRRRSLCITAARSRTVAGLALSWLLAACAGTSGIPVPEAILRPPPGDLHLVETRQRPGTHVGTAVRWGGQVIDVVHDDSGNARVQVLERRLDGDGRPVPGSPSDGRFIIEAAPSVDPDLYTPGATVTVAGTITGELEASIGNVRVRLPVVRVREFMRWEDAWRDDPYGYPAPWYGPRVHFGVGISNFQGDPGHRQPGTPW